MQLSILEEAYGQTYGGGHTVHISLHHMTEPTESIHMMEADGVSGRLVPASLLSPTPGLS